MTFQKLEWPEVGELVVTTVNRIVDHGAYVTLDEYGDKEGLLHISEISSRWVRNIRNHVRERQKIVLQVLRVDLSRGHIDLSLRRVTLDERRKKMEDWKKARRSVALLQSAANTLNLNEDEVYEKVASKLINHYGSVYSGLEAASKKGANALVEAGVTKKISKTLEKIAKEKIVVKGVSIQGILEISSMDPRGLEVIRDSLLKIKDIAIENDAEANLVTLGAPKYRLEVVAEDYKKAEDVLETILSITQNYLEEQRVSISFDRE